MKVDPKISIVTPSFNQGSFIEETICSVLEQDYQNLEYIIMDGGSTDETLSVIRRYSDKIAYWASAKDKGQSDAIERGFQRATGNIFAWLNSDDALQPGALAAVAAAFADGDPDIVAGVINVKQDGRLVYHHRTGCRSGLLSIEQLLDLDREWMTGRFFYQPEVFFSRDIYERAGGAIDCSLNYSMDYDLWVRCAQAGARIKTIDNELANFRMHAEQKTSSVAAFLPELRKHADAFRVRVGMPPLPAVLETRGQKRRLRVGMVNDYGFRYGAGRAHGRLANCLAAAQYEVVVYAFRDFIGDNSESVFENASTAMRAADVDVILMGNIHGAFPQGANLTSLAAVAPLLLVTHDFFNFTGRCPYPLGCDEYLFQCSPNCPTREQYPIIPFDEIPVAHSSKIANLSLERVHVLANSSYMETSVHRWAAVQQPGANLERRIHRVTLPVPEAAFRVGDRASARDALNISANDFVVLTSSSSVTDRRKGFRHAVAACRLVGDRRLRLFAMGWIAPEQCLDEVTYLGHLDDDEKLAQCYHAADVFVSATADETFGQVFVEAAMCGCPAIGYEVGGVSETIVHGETGWLVERNDIGALAERLREFLAMDAGERDVVRRRANAYASSRWGAASFLSGMNDVFRKVVPKDDVVIPTGVQYGGGLVMSLRFVKNAGIVWGDGFDPLEGPFPEHGIDYKLRWMTVPEATLDLRTMAAGPALLTITLANVHVPQAVRLLLGDECVAAVDLPAEPWSVSHELALALDLPAGDTRLRLVASDSLATADRELYLAVVHATLEPTTITDGFRGLVRHGGPAVPAVLVEAERDAAPAVLPGMRLETGYAAIEGPYPEIGVPMRLAWQTDAKGALAVEAAGGDILCLDVYLPCRQDIVVKAAGERYAFGAIDPSAWDQPIRLVVPMVAPAEGWHGIEIECARHVVEDGRTLHLALFGAQTMRDPPLNTASRYGRAEMPLTVRTATR